MVRAYALRSQAIRSELARVGSDISGFQLANVLELEEIERRPLGPGDVRVEILAVTAEHNVIHAAQADPVDIVSLRGGRILPGNNFLGRIVEVGDGVHSVAEGDVVVPTGDSSAGFDENGFAIRAWGFDDELDGCYAEEIVVPWRMVHPAPLDSGLDLWEIAAMPLRAGNAAHLWRRAIDIYRVKVPRERKARLNVLAFGGGVSELFLMLAEHEGHRGFYCAGNGKRRAFMEREFGIVGIDQLEYGRFADPEAVRRFRKHVNRLTGGERIQIVCDMFRGPLFEAGLSVMSRGGVNVSGGWQLGIRVEYVSPLLTVRQLTLDHAHVESGFATAATLSLFGRPLRPPIHDEIYCFEDLPRALQELQHGTQTGFPVVRVAREIPSELRHMV